MKFCRVDSNFLDKKKETLEIFENYFKYPLGTDSFRISHGENYLAFFERMGEPRIYAALEKEVVAIGAGVISRRWNSWYLCDVKVHPDFRGQRITSRLFTKYFFFNFIKCQRLFALNMENKDGRTGSIVKIMEALPWTPLKKGARLLFYYEDFSQTHEALKILSKERTDICFSSLSGKKDLILSSTNEPIPLLHMEWGEARANEARFMPQEGKLHMWSLEESHPFVAELQKINIGPKGSGLIFHHGMKKMNWNELRTSEL
jgi:GNAT superfamily N-acetyltransferase